MVFSSWTPHGASGDTPPVGQRPEARQLPLAPASLGTPSSTALDLFNAVDRRHLAGDVFTLVDTVTGPTRYRGQYAPRTLCWHAKLATDSTPKFERDGQLLRGSLADGLCTDRGRLASILEGNIVEFFVLSLARFPWTYT